MALLRRSSTRSSSSGLQEAAEKKRESRRSGFFNLIKSRTSRSEKSHGAAAVMPPQPSASASSSSAPPLPSTCCISPVMEEATQASPPPPQQELHPDHTHSVTEKTWPAGEAAEEKEVQQEDVEEKNTHIRHIGVPVMGLDLLAEMKARQGKMAVKKVRQTRVHICSQQLLLVLLVEYRKRFHRHLIIIKH